MGSAVSAKRLACVVLFSTWLGCGKQAQAPRRVQNLTAPDASLPSQPVLDGGDAGDASPVDAGTSLDGGATDAGALDAGIPIGEPEPLPNTQSCVAADYFPDGGVPPLSPIPYLPPAHVPSIKCRTVARDANGIIRTVRDTDAEGLLQEDSSWDGDGGLIQTADGFVYDAGRILKEEVHFPGGEILKTWRYRPDGQIDERTDGIDAYVYLYDDLNRRREVDFYDGTELVDRWPHTWNAAGTEEGFVDGYNSYTVIDYSPDGGIERSDNHHRDAETELGYDSSGRLIHSLFWDTLHDETFFTFDEHGRFRLKDEIVQEFGEDVFHLDEVGTYDALGRLQALALRRVPGTPTIATPPPRLEQVVRYFYSDGGVLERMELDRSGDCMPEGVRTFTHDAQGSIIAEHSSGVLVNEVTTDREFSGECGRTPADAPRSDLP